MKFASREAFRQCLSSHCLSNAVIWLLFGKAVGPKTIKTGEALEEALCFGWIDGQLQSIDEKTYSWRNCYESAWISIAHAFSKFFVTARECFLTPDAVQDKKAFIIHMAIWFVFISIISLMAIYLSFT